MWKHKTSLFVAQRNIRNFMVGKTWKWLQLFLAIKPKLKAGNVNKFRKEINDKIAFAKDHTDEMIAMREKEEAKNSGFNYVKAKYTVTSVIEPSIFHYTCCVRDDTQINPKCLLLSL